MDLGRVLIELLVVLVASRLAAETAERLRQPAVLAEIVAGLLIGPSVFGLVGRGEAIRILGEIGLILLLFEVGRQMNLRELREVGGSSLAVAAIGVVLPMALAYPAMRGLGIAAEPALFLAAAITATSVGITARVFGDLRALASSEARIVLGAAVADDVAGLIVLTVVSRVVTGGGVDAADVATVTVIAVGFVAAATLAGAMIVPRLLDGVARRARSDGTVMVLGLALALGFARVAQAARLAPIVGAFVAGLAVGRSEVADDLHRRLLPLGHFFIPIFFLQVGIDSRVSAFGNTEVLRIAVILSVIAVAGKIAAGLGVRRGRANRLLVGVAMIPRGEVGLIFASIGLASGVLDARTYAALLVVVLVSTVVTPPWVRPLVGRARARTMGEHVSEVEPEDGWLQITGDMVELAAQPPPSLAPRLALEAATQCATRRPGARLTEWLASSVPREPPAWDEALRRSLVAMLRDGTERSWRFLEATGFLDGLMPEVSGGLRRRPRDPFDLDGGAPVYPALLDGVRDVAGDPVAGKAWLALARKDVVLYAALCREAFGRGRDPSGRARRFAASISLDHFDALEVGFLVGERHVLPAAASRLGLSEDRVLDLASFVQTPERAGALYVLAVAENAMEPWQREQLDELFGLVGEALGHPDLTGASARDLVERRIGAVAVLLNELPARSVRAQVMAAPRRYLLAAQPDTIARHIRMISPKPGRFEARLQAEPTGKHDEWTVHVVVLDRRGVLAAITGAFAAGQVSVLDAQISTWRSGVAVDRFRVLAAPGTDWDAIRRRIEAALAAPPGEPATVTEGDVQVDNLASPWHTVVEVRADDRAGLLHRVTLAMARAGLEIHEASVATKGGTAVDTFFVTGKNGGKLDAGGERALRAAFAGRAPRRLRLLSRRSGARAAIW